MKREFAVISVVALLLGACTSTEATVAKPKYGSWGVDVSDMDKSVRPGDNFYHYAVGSWMKAAQIRPDRSYAGPFNDVWDQIDADVRSVVEDAADKHAPRGDIAQKVGDFYASYMDEKALEAKKVDPVKPDLATVDAVNEKLAMAPVLAELNRAGASTPFAVTVEVDPNESGRYLPMLWQGGLSFSNRDYYLDPQFVELRSKFASHVERLLSLAGYADSKEQAAQILALETKLAEVHWPSELERDIQKTRTIMPRENVERLAPGAPLRAVFDSLSLPVSASFRVGMPDVTAKTAQLFESEPLQAWKAYARYHLLAHYSPYLSKPFEDEIFNFYSRDLNGAEQPRERWSRGVDKVGSQLGDAVGELYVAKVFPAEKRQQVADMFENFRKAYAARISATTWMAPETQKEAQAKLAAMLPRVGHPDTWKSYASVAISADDLVGNVRSVQTWAWNYDVAKIGKPMDRAEWNTTPQVNNGFYTSRLNAVTLCAGFLQAPYFDPLADPAVNYGELGWLIGHEMSHGFDDQGRKYDASGALRDWWSAADAERYQQKADIVVAQFNAYEPLPGLHIDGRQTLGENIADIAGVQIAHDAYRSSLGGKEPPVIDGLTGDQRFFIAYAENWKEVDRPEFIREGLLSDSHSPNEFRVNGIVRNMDQWYTAFDVKEGEKLYLRPEDRVHIW